MRVLALWGQLLVERQPLPAQWERSGSDGGQSNTDRAEVRLELLPAL